MKIITINGARGCAVQCTREELQTLLHCIEFTLAGMDKSASPPDVERAKSIQEEIKRALR